MRNIEKRINILDNGCSELNLEFDDGLLTISVVGSEEVLATYYLNKQDEFSFQSCIPEVDRYAPTFIESFRELIDFMDALVLEFGYIA